jgi:V/A-type H+-transporting ATPase subunit I
VIIEMTLVRVIGRKSELERTLAVLQDAGTLHVTEPSADAGVAARPVGPFDARRRRHVERALADIVLALAELGDLGATVPPAASSPLTAGRAARRAAHTRRATTRLIAKRQVLRAERDALRAYAPLFAELEMLFTADHPRRRFSIHLLRLRGDGPSVRRLHEVLDRVLGEHDLRSRTLPDGEVALLLLAPAGRAADVERLLAEADVESAPVPLALGGGSLFDALPRLRPRLAEVERALDEVARDAAAIAAAEGPALVRARADLHDELRALDARALAAQTDRAFILEGWVPTRASAELAARVHRDLGDAVSIVPVASEAWHGREAPIILANPPIFEPFERLTAMLPLPRYGNVDPTPFVAVFFPMLFGVIVGDVGYGAMLALIALVLWRRGPRKSLSNDLARIAAAVASFTVIFGFLYGELFGDLGAHVLGMRPLLLDREEAILPFLVAAVALGLVHLVLGLVVAAINRRGHPREAAGRGLTALMLVLIAVALAAVVDFLPRALFTPAIVVLLVAFPLLIVLEGATALLELLTTLGHVMSYARVMALGTASVMLAVVANQMVGAFGGAAVGVVMALLFHLVNFAITLFSPTIHVLRLHYVEFFGTFFSPGGRRYQPLAHWSASAP